MPDDPQLVVVFVPALVAILHHEETEKGAPLTEAEVLAIRDKAVCMTVPVSVAAAMEASRGYSDIVAEDAWNEWQAVRVELSGPD